MEAMRPKERLLAAITGKNPDRVPWSPFLAYYWDFVDEQTRQGGEYAFLKKIGADPLLRGSHTLFNPVRKHCDVTQKQEGKYRLTIYETPVGRLEEVHTFAPSSNTWFLTRHPVSCENDVKILQYIYENTEIAPNLSAFEKDWKTYGDDALLLPVIGTELKTAMQSLVEHWFGTVELVYGLEDYPAAIEECLGVMRRRNLETVRISAGSSAECFLFYEDSSTTNLSPALFERYTLPEIAEWSRLLHRNNKLLIHHACGHIRDLLRLMANSGIDAIESIAPPPTGNVSISDAFAALPDSVALIGGIEPTILLNSTMEELKAYTVNLLCSAAGHRYVLANSDSCPPHVEEDKFRMISSLVRNFPSLM